MIGIFFSQARHPGPVDSVHIGPIGQDDTGESDADAMIAAGTALAIFADDL